MKILNFTIILFTVLSCSDKPSNKYYDKNGVLLSESQDSIHSKTYQYYKNKTLYKIDFLINHFEDGKVDIVFADSTVVYDTKGKEVLFIKSLIKEQPVKYISRIKFFKPDGTQVDTIVTNRDMDAIENSILGKDTNLFYYIPVVDHKME